MKIKVGKEMISTEKNDYPVVTSIRVRFADTDAQGVVYNGTYFTYLEVARVEFFKKIGFIKEKNFEAGYEPFVVENGCRYRNPAFFDDILDIYVKVERVGRSSVIFHYVIFNRQTDKIIVCAYTAVVFVDPKTKTPKKISEDIKRQIFNPDLTYQEPPQPLL